MQGKASKRKIMTKFRKTEILDRNTIYTLKRGMRSMSFFVFILKNVLMRDVFSVFIVRKVISIDVF